MRGRIAFGLALAGIVWGLALLIGALTFPAYEPDGTTLVEENGAYVLLPVALPALLAALAAALLSRKRVSLAWGAIGLLAVFAMIAAASIGLLVLPGVLFLAAAAVLTSPAPERGAASPE